VRQVGGNGEGIGGGDTGKIQQQAGRQVVAGRQKAAVAQADSNAVAGVGQAQARGGHTAGTGRQWGSVVRSVNGAACRRPVGAAGKAVTCGKAWQQCKWYGR